MITEQNIADLHKVQTQAHALTYEDFIQWLKDNGATIRFVDEVITHFDYESLTGTIVGKEYLARCFELYSGEDLIETIFTEKIVFTC